MGARDYVRFGEGKRMLLCLGSLIEDPEDGINDGDLYVELKGDADGKKIGVVKSIVGYMGEDANDESRNIDYIYAEEHYCSEEFAVKQNLYNKHVIAAIVRVKKMERGW